MQTWRRPELPSVPGRGISPKLGQAGESAPGPVVTLYVCGITPYDATHVGHAATYVAFDTLVRAWLDAGLEVEYVQNVTDVDEPLLERARYTEMDWRALGDREVRRYRADMELLSVIPPDALVGVTEQIPRIGAAVRTLERTGFAYRLGDDIYFDSAAAERDTAWRAGAASGLSRAQRLVLAAERGGDPERDGKRDGLDPVLWRGSRPGEPTWRVDGLPEGRPGWHIECSVIAALRLGTPVSVEGGGRDLVYPHHEFTDAHTLALTGVRQAQITVHTGLVSFRGEKMSKSLGNLVFVASLVERGADPRAIRLALLAQHYRSDWDWSDAVLETATRRLRRWTAWASQDTGAGSGPLPTRLRDAIGDDLDTPRALAAVDAAAASGSAPDVDDLVGIRALLGITL